MNRFTDNRSIDTHRGMRMSMYLEYARSVIEGRHIPDLDCLYRKPVRKLPVAAKDTSSADGAGECAQTAGDDGDDGDGDGDGDGDPDSDRTCPPAPSTSPQHRPLPQAPATLPRTLPLQQHRDLPKSPPNRSRRTPSRISNDSQPDRWRYLTRGQWITSVLILFLIALAGALALLGKDGLAENVLTSTIPWVVFGFLRHPRK